MLRCDFFLLPGRAAAWFKALKLLKMAGNGAQHAQAKGAKPRPWIQKGLFNSDPRTRPSARSIA
jgi:hypothetical protein